MILLFFLVIFPHPAGALWKTNLEMHVLDVGQADCIYIETSNGKNVLIDSGDEHDGAKVVSYLQKRGIDHLDYVIATHPHHDHIGSMDMIMESFNIGEVYMPAVKYHTGYYRRLMNILDQTGIDIVDAKAGVKIELAKSVILEFVAPSRKKYKVLNDHSAVIRIHHYKKTFLLMADAGVRSEREMLKRIDDKRVDVLKVAHHGANSSTSHELLEQTKPKYAIISVGRKNRYNYPSTEVLKRLTRYNIQIFRTDKLGTVIMKSDGKSVKFLTEFSQL